MTAVLDLHPTPGLPGVVVAAVHEALDGLAAVDDAASVGVGATVVECERAIRRLEALKLRLLAVADSTRVAATTGHSSTAAWLAAQTRSGRARSARETSLATALDEGLPSTRQALEEGAVSSEHASVIADATRRLPTPLTRRQVETVEATLADKARRLDPTELRRVARRALEAVERDVAKVDAHEDAQLMDEERRAYDRARLTLHDHGDGTTSGHFTVPTLSATMLRTVLDAMTSPRRGRPGSGEAQSGRPSGERDWAHERGKAFVQLLDHVPTDHLHGKVAATVLVTLDLDTLSGRLKAAGLATGDLVSAAEARRLACGAGIVPAVLGGTSQPLDLGRSKRFFTEAQRVAGALQHHGCAADGCDVPYAWTEAHHHTPWSRHGRSDLRDLVPLCGFHHRRVHDPGFDHRRRPDGSVTFHRRT